MSSSIQVLKEVNIKTHSSVHMMFIWLFILFDQIIVKLILLIYFMELEVLSEVTGARAPSSLLMFILIFDTKLLSTEISPNCYCTFHIS